MENALKNLELMFSRLQILLNQEYFLQGVDAREDEEVIGDAGDAVRYSTDQDIQDDYPGVQYWTSMLEYNNRLLDIEDIGIDELNAKKINEEISGLSAVLTEIVAAKIYNLKLPDDISEVISENFNVFLNEFSYFGGLSDFQKYLLDVYERGFFPCGWRGEFPKGNIIIFSDV